jgi:two-component system sensor histidine kinase KdpD
VHEPARPTGEQMLARIQTAERARLRIYIGAAPGVGKTYSMLEDAHAFRREGVDIVVGLVETYGRAETDAQIGDLEIVPKRKVEYRGVVLEEMDVDAILARKPQMCVVDELAHTNAPGSKHEKRYQDVLDLLGAGISVLTAVNIQHLETLNDAVSRVTGVRVRETVPDTFLDRADEVVNVDVTVQELADAIAAGQGLQTGEGRTGADQLLSRDQSVNAARAGAARGCRRSGGEGGVAPAA